MKRRPAASATLKRPAAIAQPGARAAGRPASAVTLKRPARVKCVVLGRDGDELVCIECGTDDQGRAHGQGKATFRSGDVYVGAYRNGYEHGSGQWRFADGSVLTSTFRCGAAHGDGCYEDHEEGIRRHGGFVHGELEGFGWESDEDGEVVLRSHFQASRQRGYCESFDDSGCTTAGHLDKDGSYTGSDIAFVFPDGVTCISGEFSDGDFVRGRYGQLVEPLAPRQQRLAVAIEKQPGCSVRFAEASPVVSAPIAGALAAELLVSDDYESERVEVRESDCHNGAGMGLFAKRSLLKNEIFSFYNGVRLTHSEVDGRDWSLNERTATLDSETVLDVPLDFATPDRYCASLGHFANHSSMPNSRYSSGFEHPRFGEIVCLRAIRDIGAGEEILCDYAYQHEAVTAAGETVQDVPSWFANDGQTCSEPMPRRSRSPMPKRPRSEPAS